MNNIDLLDLICDYTSKNYTGLSYSLNKTEDRIKFEQWLLDNLSKTIEGGYDFKWNEKIIRLITEKSEKEPRSEKKQDENIYITKIFLKNLSILKKDPNPELFITKYSKVVFEINGNFRWDYWDLIGVLDDILIMKSLAEQFPEKFRTALITESLHYQGTLIMAAVSNGSLETVKFLADQFPEEFKSNFNMKFKSNILLHIFNKEMIELLAEKFDREFRTLLIKQNNEGSTPFHQIAYHQIAYEGSLLLLKFLVEKFPEEFKNALTIKNNDQDTLLHIATFQALHLNDIQMLIFILEKFPVDLFDKIFCEEMTTHYRDMLSFIDKNQRANPKMGIRVLELLNAKLQEYQQPSQDELKIMEEVLDGIMQPLQHSPPSPQLTRENLTFLLKNAIQNRQQVTINQESYLVEFEKETRKFEVLHLEAVFAHGGRGEVRKAISCFNSTVEVLKQAIAAKGEKANVTIQKEYHLLTFIHSEGQCLGIQAPPRKLVQLAKAGEIEQYGFLGAYYEEDYREIKISNLHDCFWQFYQLLSGLMILDQKNILHGDLKPQNLFFKRDKDGTALVVIGDTGEAVRVTPEVKNDELLSYGGHRGHTKAYSPLRDLEFARDFHNRGERFYLIQVEKKRDVFAIGSIMYRKLQWHRPYEYDKHGYPQVNDPLKPITNLPIPKDLETLIQEMLHPDYASRPYGNVAFPRFNNIFVRELPDLYQQVQSKIQREYPGTGKAGRFN